MMGTRSLPKRLVRSLRVGGEITGGRDGDADVSLDWLCDRAGAVDFARPSPLLLMQMASSQM